MSDLSSVLTDLARTGVRWARIIDRIATAKPPRPRDASDENEPESIAREFADQLADDAAQRRQGPL